MGSIINTAVIGFGYSARVFHIPLLEVNQGYKLIKVVERHGEQSRELYPWIKVVKSVSELVKDSETELAIITTPNLSHFSLAKELLLSGKHVVVEKPFTITYIEATELIEIAEKNNRLLSVFQNRRWDGDYLTVKNIIESGSLGELVEFESHFDRFRNYFKPMAWREENQPGSGLLYDLGPHLIDQTLCLFGQPESLIADVRIQREGGKADDNFSVIMNYGRLKVTLKAGMLVKGKAPRFILHGTQGSFVKYGLDPQENSLKSGLSPLSPYWNKETEDMWGALDITLNGLNVRGKVETLPGEYTEYYNNLYDAIANKAEPAVKPEQAAETIRIIELAIESAAKGRRILLR